MNARALLFRLFEADLMPGWYDVRRPVTGIFKHRRQRDDIGYHDGQGGWFDQSGQPMKDVRDVGGPAVGTVAHAQGTPPPGVPPPMPVQSTLPPPTKSQRIGNEPYDWARRNAELNGTYKPPAPVVPAPVAAAPVATAPPAAPVSAAPPAATPSPAVTAAANTILPAPAAATPSPAVPTPSPAVPTPSPAVPTPSPAVPTPSPAVPTPSPAVTAAANTILPAPAATPPLPVAANPTSRPGWYQIHRKNSSGKLYLANGYFDGGQTWYDRDLKPIPEPSIIGQPASDPRRVPAPPMPFKPRAAIPPRPQRP